MISAMLTRLVFMSLFLAIALVPFPGGALNAARADQGDCPHYSNPKIQAAVDMVHDAVILIADKGKAAFDDFTRTDSRWLQGSSYLFVHDMDGVLVFNPAYPGMIGKNMLDFKDVIGKKPVRQMIDQVTAYGRESGWVHYLWPMPGQIEPSWKSSYVHRVTAPGGKQYLVGTGLYDVPMERCFVVQQVEDAVRRLRSKGRQAFELLRSRTGPFVWREVYVYVIDLDTGVQYVNPFQPEWNETDVSGVRDWAGDRFYHRMLTLLKKHDSGWVEYQWPKPGRWDASTKSAYVKRVEIDGKRYLVGSGFYLD